MYILDFLPLTPFIIAVVFPNEREILLQPWATIEEGDWNKWEGL